MGDHCRAHGWCHSSAAASGSSQQTPMSGAPLDAEWHHIVARHAAQGADVPGPSSARPAPRARVDLSGAGFQVRTKNTCEKIMRAALWPSAIEIKQIHVRIPRQMESWKNDGGPWAARTQCASEASPPSPGRNTPSPLPNRQPRQGEMPLASPRTHCKEFCAASPCCPTAAATMPSSCRGRSLAYLTGIEGLVATSTLQTQSAFTQEMLSNYVRQT